jgi:hypothetical protein
VSAFIRNLIANVVTARRGTSRHTFVQERWGTVALQKAVVPAADLVGSGNGTDPGAAEFFGSVVEQSIIGRIRPRAVPANVRLLRPDSSATGYWVAQNNPAPLSLRTVQGSALGRRKVAAIIASSMEAFEAQGLRAERALESDLRRALVAVLDDAFIAPGNAGVTDEMPASVTYGTTPLASTGDPSEDLKDLVSTFGGDLATASFVTDPVTAAQLVLWRDATGGVCFPDAGPTGGSLLGLPLVTSRACPRDTSGGMIALLDGPGIAVNLEELEVQMSRAATLEMSDVPTGEGDTPVSQSVAQVSLFQIDAVAMLATMYANWETQRVGAVSVVEGCQY